MAIYPLRDDPGVVYASRPRYREYGYSTLGLQNLKEQLSIRDSHPSTLSYVLLFFGVCSIPVALYSLTLFSAPFYGYGVLAYVLMIIIWLGKKTSDSIKLNRANSRLADTFLDPRSSLSWRALVYELMFAARRNNVWPLEIEEHFVSLLLIDHVNAELKLIVDGYLRRCRELPGDDEEGYRIVARKDIDKIFHIVNDDMQARNVVFETVDVTKQIQQNDARIALESFSKMNDIDFNHEAKARMLGTNAEPVLRVSNRLKLSDDEDKAVESIIRGPSLHRTNPKLYKALGLPPSALDSGRVIPSRFAKPLASQRKWWKYRR